MVLVPRMKFFIEAVDVVDDDGMFRVALVDPFQRVQRLVGHAQPRAVSYAGGDKA